MAKPWCIVSSHPLVIQIAEKYNISKNKAKNILTAARRNNPALNNDELSLDYVTSQKEFKEAYNTYVKTEMSAEDAAFRPVWSKKERADVLDDVSEYLGKKLSEDELNDLLDEYANARSYIQTSGLNAASVAKVMTAFRNSKRLNFIGHFITQYTTSIMLSIQQNAGFRNKHDIPTYNSRKDYYLDPNAIEYLKAKLKKTFRQQAKALEQSGGNATLVAELNAAADNLNTLLYMYGVNLFRTEGVRVTPKGNFVSTDFDDESLERNEGDTENQENEDAGENPTSGFSVSDSNMSVVSKMVPDIKTLLASFRDTDRNGNLKADPFGYGLWQFVSPNLAMNKILLMCQGCTTIDEMISVFKKNQTAVPWISQLITVLDTEQDGNHTGETSIPKSRKELLRTRAFKSFRKQWTRMRLSYTAYDTEGNPIMLSRDANMNHYKDKLWNQVRRKFYDFSGADIFDNGELSLAFLKKFSTKVQFNQKLLDIKKIYQEEGREFKDGKATIEPKFERTAEALYKLEEELSALLKGFGIKVSERTLNESLSNSKSDMEKTGEVIKTPSGVVAPSSIVIATKFKRMQLLINNVNDIRKSMTDWFLWMGRQKAGEVVDTKYTNPLLRRKGNSNYENIRDIRDAYDKVISFLSEFSSDGVEPTAHMAGKDYYAYNNPSSVQTIVEGLTADTERAREYIREKYAQDPLWFMTDASTADDPHFYSEILEYIYHGKGGELLDYSEMPSINGKSYTELSDKEYALAIQNDYFNNVGMRAGVERDGTVAWYRMLINSDKPKFATLRWKKYNEFSKEAEDAGGFKNLIAEKAIPFFAQELKRSASVIQHMVSGVGPFIENYDPDLKDGRGDVIKKIKEKKKIEPEDVVIDGRYVFRNSGASFYSSQFINDAIEIAATGKPASILFDAMTVEEQQEYIDYMTRLGEYAVDRIFNSDLYPEDREAVESTIMPDYRNAFHQYMKEMHAEYVSFLERSGLYAHRPLSTTDPKTGDKVTAYHMNHIRGMLFSWNQDMANPQKFIDQFSDAAKQAMFDERGITPTGDNGKRNPDFTKWLPYYKERFAYESMLEEFVYNNWLAKVNMAQVFDVDLAFYGTTPNFQKRNAQVVSSGYPIDPTATLHGDRISDGKLRSVTLKTEFVISKHIDNLEHLLRKRAEKITNPKIKKQFELGIEDTLYALRNIDPTDGQGLTGLTALRKKMVGLGEWSRSDSKEDDIRGYWYDGNNKKRWIYTDEAIYQRIKRGEHRVEDYLHVFAQPQKPFIYGFTKIERDGRTITVPVQHKNSEYALIFLSAFQEADSPNSQVAAISKFLEATAKDTPLSGVDTVNFDSVVKIGNNSNAIDISGLDGVQTYHALMSAVYEKDEKGDYITDHYKPNTVTEIDEKEYKIQQEKKEHFKNSQQPTGSQIKILAINNIPDDMECTLASGEKVTGKQLRDRYFDLLRKKMMNSERAVGKRFGLLMPKRTRLHKLSNVIRDMAASDARFSAEEAKALSIVDRNGNPVFALPLDDMGHQSAIEAKIMSLIRKTYYKEKTNGGIVVQASSWGVSDNLHIRFYSTNEYDKTHRDSILATEEEFNKNKGKYIESTYEEYRNKYQQGYAYFECEIPMPDYIKKMLMVKGKIDRKYLNSDGTWNMDEIKKTIPASMLDAICYRVPTEAKYSMMVCKIVRFAPEFAGSVARYPLELTAFTGADFDIDTDTVELRPIPGTKTEDIDNEIFDLQLAALRSEGSVQETFKPGDFSDLQRLSYYARLLESGYDKDAIRDLSTKQLKKMCEIEESLDLMNPMTDIILHNQNADAKDMIGIAAVGVTSHAFLSLYNDPNNINNTTRIVLKEGESFTVKIGDNELIFAGAVPLDMMYDMDGKLISTEISKYVGGSADAAKDAAEYRLNITKKTLPLLITMHRIGVSSDVARLFIDHPVMKDAVQMWNDNPALDAEDVAQRLYDRIKEEELTLAEEEGRPLSEQDIASAYEDAASNTILDYDDLIDAKSRPDDVSLNSKFMILHMLETLGSISNSIRNLDSFYRYNSSNAMKGSSFLDRFARRQMLEKLQNNLNKEEKYARILLPDNITPAEGYPLDNYGKLCTMFPYIAQTIFGEQELIDSIILDNMPTYSPVFFEAARRLNVEDKPDALKKLYSGWKNYLFFVGPNRIADFHDEQTARFYTRDFSQYFSKKVDELSKNPETKALMEDNSFIEAIGYTAAKPGYGAFEVLSTNIAALSGPELELFKSDWELLLQHPETRKLATDTAIHFIARAASFSNSTPVTAIPYGVKKAIPNYFNALDNASNFPMSEDDVDNFCDTVCRNNAEDHDLVPYFYNSINTYVSFEDGIVEMSYGRRVAEKFTEKDADGNIVFLSPVIAIENPGQQTMLVRLKDHTATVLETEDGITLQFEGEQVDPLGIPNQIAEYTGFDNSESIFLDEDQEAPNPMETADVQQDFVEFEPIRPGENVHDTFVNQGYRVGTYVDTMPYGDIDINKSIPKYLTADSSNITNNSFLESRAHLKRAEKLAGILGLKINGLQRTTGEGSPTYVINVTNDVIGSSSSKQYSSQHLNARKMASLLGILGYTPGETSVKTYVTSSDDYNKIEFSIPGIDVSDSEELINDAYKLGLPISATVNHDRSELTISIDVNSNNGNATIKAIRDASAAVSSLYESMKRSGKTEADGVEINYAWVDTLDEEEQKETIKEIYDDENIGTSNTRQDRKNSILESNSKAGTQVRLRDIAGLALRKAEGQQVEQSEIRELFGERKVPLNNVESSYASSQLAERVIDEMGDISDEIQAIADGLQQKHRSPGSIISDMIINVANWIIGNRSQSQIESTLMGSGISPDTAREIMSIIKKEIDKQDLC